MTDADPWTTVVVDAGARYGIHPTWRGIEAPLAYAMFEPDPAEAQRLERKYADNRDVTVTAKALGDQPDGTVQLWMTAHRGYVGAEKPNPSSLWFGSVRSGEGDVVGSIEAPCTTLDTEFAGLGRRADFLKIDVEGAEPAVLRGAARTLEQVLAMRVEVQFDDSFTRQTASEILREAVDVQGFRLMRLDYDGRGQPLSYLVDDGGYGALCGCDAVFMRKPETVSAWGGDATPAGLVKLAVFALRNTMPDYAVPCLEALAAKGWTAPADEPPIHRYLRKLFTFAALRVRALSPELYSRARADYERFFGQPMLDRHDVFESDWLNPA